MDEKKLLNWPGLQYLYYTKIFPYYKRAFYGIKPVVPMSSNEIWYTSMSGDPISDFDSSVAFDASLLSNVYDDNKFVASYNSIITKFGDTGNTNGVLMMNEDLETIVIPWKVNEIDTSIGALVGCPNLNSIKVDSRNTVFDSRNDCNAIMDSSTDALVLGCQYTTIPNETTSISDYAFFGCPGLTSIELNGNVKSIGRKAFSQCEQLVTVTLSDGLERIGDYAFSNNASIDAIEIPKTVSHIGDCAFYDSVLPKIIFSDEIGSLSIGNSAFANCVELTDITIPDSVVSLGDSLFYGCYNLTDVVLPDTLKEITAEMFYECISLMAINIPSQLEVISGNAFAHTTISNWDFSQCPNLSLIGSGAFSQTMAESIMLPESIVEIQNEAFAGSSKLVDVTIHALTPPMLGENVFNEIDNDYKINVPASVLEDYQKDHNWILYADHIVGF